MALPHPRCGKAVEGRPPDREAALWRLRRRAWERWKGVAHAIGTFQARVLLSVFYFIVVPPFALIVKVKDPLGLRRRGRAGGWIERPAADMSTESARRQF